MISYKKREHARALIQKELNKQGLDTLRPNYAFIEYLKEKYEID